MVATVIIATALCVAGYPGGSWSGLSDLELVSRQGEAGAGINGLQAELEQRLQGYSSSDRGQLVELLIVTVEGPVSFERSSPRGACSSTLASFSAEASPDLKARIQAHMRKVILDGRAGDSHIIRGYLWVLPQLERSDANQDVIKRFLTEDKYGQMRDTHYEPPRTYALYSLARWGSAAVPSLIEQMAQGASDAAEALGRTGTEEAYAYLVAEAQNRSGQYRRACTGGLGGWARTVKEEAKRAAAFQVLMSLACDQDPLVKEDAIKELGSNGQPVPVCGLALAALAPTHLWLGLRNSDDQGTRFDLRTELLINGTPVATGLTRCITGVTRNQSNALESTVNWPQFESRALQPTDVITLRVSTRIGTNADDTFCGGHSNAVGLRVYYDSANRPARFGITVTPAASANHYLHSNGTSCGSSGSTGVTSLTTDSTAPTGTSARCRDSGSVKFSGGNAWVVVDSWTVPVVQ